MPLKGGSIENRDPEKYDEYGTSYKAKWIESEMIINAIGEILDGVEPSDFELLSNC
jgi:hypothetical protein